MKVVHLACVAHPQGGIGTVAGREVALLRARGVDAELIVPSSLDTDHPTERVRSFIREVHPWWRVGNAAILTGIRKRVQGADVVHLHYPFYGTAEPLLLFSRPTDPPMVMTFHMDATAPGLRGLGFSLHRWLLQPILFSRVKRIFVSSMDYVRRSSLRRWFVTYPERVQELPFGVDTDFFSPLPSHAPLVGEGSRAYLRTRLQLPFDAPILLFVGGLDRAHHFKGLPQLFEALEALPETTQLLVIGEGDLRSSYEERAQRLGIRGRDHFLGRVDDETLRDAYRSADIFVFPSTNEAEAFGLVAVEAASCGLPVIASDLPGVRTVVRHGETGWLVPPKDVSALASACLTLLADSTFRTRLGAAARPFVVERFSWDRHVDELIVAYQRLCVSPS